MLGILNLFDKFIHIEFEEYMTQAEAMEIYNEEEEQKSKLLQTPKVKIAPTETQWTAFVDKHTNKVKIYTPEYGVKPYITVNATFLPNMRTTQVSVSIKNLEFDVNINTFSYMRIRMGYFNGPSVMFRGVIINSYIESPNPNGNTVFQMLDAGMFGDLLNPKYIYLSFFGKTSWLEALKESCTALGLIIDVRGLTDAYNDVPMINAIKTKRLKSAKELIAYFSETAKAAFYVFGLTAPTITLTGENVVVSVIGNIGTGKFPLPALDQVKSVSFTGGGIMIKAPYNPLISPMRNFYIDPAYFKGRFNAQNIRPLDNRLFNPANDGTNDGLITGVTGSDNGNTLLYDKGLGASRDGVYQCLTLNVQFDTYNMNEMQVTGVASDATEDTSETLRKALEEHQQKKADGYFIDYPPPAYPPFWKIEDKPEESGEPEAEEEEIVIPVSKNKGTAKGSKGIVTLPDILNHYLTKKNLFSGSTGTAIEFKVGGENRSAAFNDRNGVNYAFINFLDKKKWFSIHTALQKGGRNENNIFGAGALTCITGLKERVIEIQKKIDSFTMPENSEGVFYMLYQRKWINEHKNDNIAPYIAGYIIAGEKIGNVTFSGNRTDYDNDVMMDIYSHCQEQSQTIHVEGPNWNDVLTYDENVILLLKELCMWIGDRKFKDTPGINYTDLAWGNGKKEYQSFIEIFKRLIDNLSLLKDRDI
jgi:hypothetical protein